MAENSAQFAALHDQNMAAMGAIATMYVGDLKTISKAQDYQWLEGLPGLSEAVGIREVASRVNPAGPTPAVP